MGWADRQTETQRKTQTETGRERHTHTDRDTQRHRQSLKKNNFFLTHKASSPWPIVPSRKQTSVNMFVKGKG